MFGLENQKQEKKKFEAFVFDLESEWKDKKTYEEMKKRIEDRILKIKQILKSGERKEEFDEFGILLHGYTSLLKVMARGVAKQKKQ